MSMTARTFGFLGAAGLSLATGCSGPHAPADPTWNDVYPIVQGQCLHCHGSTAAQDGGGFRFDFLDASTTCRQEEADDLPDGFRPSPSFLAARRQILADIKPAAAGARPKMPPEPARLLEDWQVETLERFITKLDALPRAELATRGLGPASVEARPPTIRVTTARLGARLTVDYVVSDANSDPVIGKIRVADTAGGSVVHGIASAGAGRAVLDVTGLDGPLQMEARLCDGRGIRLRGPADGLPVP